MPKRSRSVSQQPPLMSGRLDDVPLPELVQLFTNGRRSVRIEVSTRDKRRAEVIVERGHVARCRFGDLLGEEAFFALFGQGGRFLVYHIDPERSERSAVSRGWQELILEAARRSDEADHDEEAVHAFGRSGSELSVGDNVVRLPLSDIFLPDGAPPADAAEIQPARPVPSSAQPSSAQPSSSQSTPPQPSSSQSTPSEAAMPSRRTPSQPRSSQPTPSQSAMPSPSQPAHPQSSQVLRRPSTLVSARAPASVGPRTTESVPPQTDPFDGIFADAMRAYLRRDYDGAAALFTQCRSMRPGDKRVRANLKRLAERKRKR